MDRLEPAFFDDSDLTRSGFSRGDVLTLYFGCRSRKLYSPAGISSANALRLGIASMPKTKLISPVIPAVEMRRLREVGVAAHRCLKTGLAAETDHLVQSRGGMFVRRPIATAIDQVERFGGVGQRDQ